MKSLKIFIVLLIILFLFFEESIAQVSYYNTTRTGSYPSAIGYETKAYSYTLASGYRSEANGTYSHAFGFYSKANNYCSFATGNSCISSGYYAVAMCYGSQSPGMSSFAAGQSCVANGWAAVALGYSTDATANHAHAFGINTNASGQYSTTLNDMTTASASQSTAMGYRTIAASQNSVAMGKWNKGLSGVLLEIGNGTGSSTRANAFTVFSNGDIGIGTTDTHGYRLAVNGDLGIKGEIEAEEIQVFTPLWSDFVFSDDYKLMNLEDLDKYINKNNHLPGIPTNSEISKNGISLGYMNSLLLQKIEELTLYIIDQNIKIKELEEEINKFKN